MLNFKGLPGVYLSHLSQSHEIVDAADPEPSSRFAEIWEQKGRWFTGPNVLSGIVDRLRGKAILAELSPQDPHVVLVCLPLPPAAFSLIPEELLGVFDHCYADIMNARVKDAQRLQSPILGRVSGPKAIAEANGLLRDLERQREQTDRGQLWKVAATSFGLDWRFLPPAIHASGSPLSEQ